MSGYKYKMHVVNPDKNIVSLSPTMGTYAKALMPSLVFFGGLAAFGAVVNYREKKALNLSKSQDEAINLANKK